MARLNTLLSGGLFGCNGQDWEEIRATMQNTAIRWGDNMLCNRHQMGAGNLITFPLLCLCASLYQQNMPGTVLQVQDEMKLNEMYLLLTAPRCSRTSPRKAWRAATHRSGAQGKTGQG